VRVQSHTRRILRSYLHVFAIMAFRHLSRRTRSENFHGLPCLAVTIAKVVEFSNIPVGCAAGAPDGSVNDESMLLVFTTE
jgi:hypothetical protein